LKRVASSSIVCHTNPTKKREFWMLCVKIKLLFANWSCWGVTYDTTGISWCSSRNKTDTCDAFMGEHGRQKQLHISSLLSIDWCSVIKLQINIANNYFGREQL
jgi:hypothetical protein